MAGRPLRRARMNSGDRSYTALSNDALIDIYLGVEPGNRFSAKQVLRSRGYRDKDFLWLESDHRGHAATYAEAMARTYDPIMDNPFRRNPSLSRLNPDQQELARVKKAFYISGSELEEAERALEDAQVSGGGWRAELRAKKALKKAQEKHDAIGAQLEFLEYGHLKNRS